MNLDKIIKECPRAWEECMRFFIHPHNWEALEFKYVWNPNTDRIEIWESDYLDLEIHPRELYNYFDSVGVRIEITHIGNSYGWIFDICANGKSTPDHEGSFDNRTEAEYRAFERAFEIREQQIAKSVK